MTIGKFRMDEACERLGVEEGFVVRCIRSHWVRPATPFEMDEEDLARVEFVRELQQDLEVNDASVPIILDLVDRLLFLEDRIRFSARKSEDAVRF